MHLLEDLHSKLGRDLTTCNELVQRVCEGHSNSKGSISKKKMLLAIHRNVRRATVEFVVSSGHGGLAQGGSCGSVLEPTPPPPIIVPLLGHELRKNATRHS